MDRVSLRVPERHVDKLDRHADNGEFANRSEAIRTAIRDMLNDMDEPRHQMWAKGQND